MQAVQFELTENFENRVLRMENTHNRRGYETNERIQCKFEE